MAAAVTAADALAAADPSVEAGMAMTCAVAAMSAEPEVERSTYAWREPDVKMFEAAAFFWEALANRSPTPLGVDTPCCVLVATTVAEELPVGAEEATATRVPLAAMLAAQDRATTAATREPGTALALSAAPSIVCRLVATRATPTY